MSFDVFSREKPVATTPWWFFLRIRFPVWFVKKAFKVDKY
jgi:hypothetical protein